MSHRKMEDGRKCKHCSRLLPMTQGSETLGCPNCQPNHSNIQTIQRPTSSDQEKRRSGIQTLGKMLKNVAGHVSPGISLNMPSPTGSPKARHKKRAVLCGVTYTKRWYKLKGTINDVKSMRELLVHTFKFPVESIRVLTEQEPNQEFTPTRKNIQNALQWLVEGCQAGDSLVFYFSGHGLRQPDFSGDEIDGFDETICPVDFRKEGMIIDNDINSTIVQPLRPGIKLHAIVDSCHSGTILDLLYMFNRKAQRWVDNFPPSGANKRTSGGLAICFSACDDSQMAADTTAFSRNEMAGAMTYSFIRALKNNPKITYGGLLDSMHEAIEQANREGCLKNRILEKVFHTKLLQDPQLSSSEPFEIYSKLFEL